MQRLIKITNDGSTTLYDNMFDEHFHSIFGAEQESMHIFIKNGFCATEKKQLCILEMGFGTGLNAFLTLLACKHSAKTVLYHTYDLFPITDFELIKQLNFPSLTANNKSIFLALHQVPWNQEINITPEFKIVKIKSNFIEANLPIKYDLVYYDAFSPQKQPELWTQEIFIKIFNAMNDGGILTTYCAKGKVKRTLKKIGFEVKLIQGPLGKRQMTKAIKKTTLPPQ